MARRPSPISKTLELGQIADFFEAQTEELVIRTTAALFGKLSTRTAPGAGTPVDTGTLLSSWAKESLSPFVGRVYVSSKLNPNGSNTQDYAPAVMYGQSLPPSWGGKYRTRQGTTKGYPDLIMKEVATQDIPKIMRRIGRSF